MGLCVLMDSRDGRSRILGMTVSSKIDWKAENKDLF